MRMWEVWDMVWSGEGRAGSEGSSVKSSVDRCGQVGRELAAELW
jgi:hypothetical protein